MNILATGPEDIFQSLRALIPERHSLSLMSPNEITSQLAQQYNLLIDLDLDETPERLSIYSTFLNRPIIVRSVTQSLASMVSASGTEPQCVLIGMNLLTGFISRPHAEVSLLQEKDADTLDNLMTLLGLPYTRVEDRAGMVSPRIVCMIINEASFLLQEKGATPSGIDTAMLLGVNYPKGPLAWADEIGLPLVVKTLQAVHAETGDDRYRVCPLLLRMSQRGEKFFF
jgi:3-hydroxybutyryl-CoA dehydrogenase